MEKNYKDITSFEDACNLLKLDSTLLPGLGKLPKRFKKSLLAYYKLLVISEALNHPWKPDVDANITRFYSVFTMTESGLERTGCKGMERSQVITNSHLSFKDTEIAIYAGNQFIELWEDMLIPNIFLINEAEQRAHLIKLKTNVRIRW